MTNHGSEQLPDVPVTDGEVGVEMIFLDPVVTPDEPRAGRVLADPLWAHPAPRLRPLTA